MITEVLKPGDRRSQSKLMEDAIKNDVEGLVSLGNSKVIKKEEVLRGANILTCKLVRVIKSDVD